MDGMSSDLSASCAEVLIALEVGVVGIIVSQIDKIVNPSLLVIADELNQLCFPCNVTVIPH